MLKQAVFRFQSAGVLQGRTSSEFGFLARRMAASATDGPSTATPPPDAARGATADLCDVFIPDPLDIVTQRNVQIVEPLFRSSSSDSQVFSHLLPPMLTCIAFMLCRDFGGKLRFNGQVTTVKCFENNPLVRKVTDCRFSWAFTVQA